MSRVVRVTDFAAPELEMCIRDSGCAVRQLRAEGAKRLVVQLPPEHPARGFFRYFGFAEQGSDRLERSIEVPELK